jgi:hypothetical protein
VTQWTAIGTDLNPTNLVVFNSALWFSGFDAGQYQLYKLGSDGSVTQWTANPGAGLGLEPADKTVFNDALWFRGDTPANGPQLYKLGDDGSVTLWTKLGTELLPEDMTVFNNALWFNGVDTTTGQSQLYKLGSDGSVTKWTANPGAGGGLAPGDLTVFNGALWFQGEAPANGNQLYKLGSDGSVTLWTKIGTNLDPIPVSTAANATDTPLSVANDALWFQGNTSPGNSELYKLGADGSFTLWGGTGAGAIGPQDWAVLGS